MDNLVETTSTFFYNSSLTVFNNNNECVLLCAIKEQTNMLREFLIL